jgi:hypothetical protein
MKIKALFLALAFSVLAIAGMAGAGTFQNTPYSTNSFSATFNANVTADAPVASDDNQSTNYSFWSYNPTQTVGQLVIVRIVNHDIPVDLTSSDFYADDDRTGGTITNRSTGEYQGHPFTYTRRDYVDNGVELSKRTRFIIVNSREVIFIMQIAPFTDGPVGSGDQPQWFEFEDSLSIR